MKTLVFHRGGDVSVSLVGGVGRGDSVGDGGRQWWWRGDGVELSQLVVAVEMAVAIVRGGDVAVALVGGVGHGDSGGDGGRQWWWRGDGIELSQPVMAVEMAVSIVVRWSRWCWWRRGDDGSVGWRVAKRRLVVGDMWPKNGRRRCQIIERRMG
nr:hypothetical protein [Tanacetum cinerariifolium]